jgi:hypothetical protein
LEGQRKIKEGAEAREEGRAGAAGKHGKKNENTSFAGGGCVAIVAGGKWVVPELPELGVFGSLVNGPHS